MACWTGTRRLPSCKVSTSSRCPATYDEPKGIFYWKPWPAASPVQPERGGFTEIVKQTGGGLLVEPDNVDSLASGF